LSEGGSDLTGWAKDHAARYEVAPLFEMVKGNKIQVGFTVSLYARLPLDKAPGTERRAEAAAIRERLAKLVQSLVPREGSRARVEIDPPRAAVVLESEGQREPEIALYARVFHGDEYFAEATAAEEKKVHDVTRRLTEMGFQERHRRVP
jgi:hypothetical protein